jgi:hypothetical protein
MTTYLATLMVAGTDPTEVTDEFRTDAFCSPGCRLAYFFLKSEFPFTSQYFRTDENYEFHERCSNCDELVYASWIPRISTLDQREPIANETAIFLAVAALRDREPSWLRLRRALGFKFSRVGSRYDRRQSVG